MDIEETPIRGMFVIRTSVFADSRGTFQKPYNRDAFEKRGIEADFSEIYFSQSECGVLRGMHFQLPPYAVAKLIFVSGGSILDVALDIRASSPTFGRCFSIEIDHASGLALYLPVGIAHGFLSRARSSIVNYAQTAVYSREHDAGIRFDSFGFDWGINSPILSERDASFPGLEDFSKVFP